MNRKTHRFKSKSKWKVFICENFLGLIQILDENNKTTSAEKIQNGDQLSLENRGKRIPWNLISAVEINKKFSRQSKSILTIIWVCSKTSFMDDTTIIFDKNEESTCQQLIANLVGARWKKFTFEGESELIWKIGTQVK